MANKKPEIPSKQITLYDKSHDIYTLIPFDVMTFMGNENFDHMSRRRAQVSTKPEKLMFSRQMLWEAIIHPEDRVKLSELDGDEVINLFSDWVLAEDDGN
jgi:hypothetical protein